MWRIMSFIWFVKVIKWVNYCKFCDNFCINFHSYNLDLFLVTVSFFFLLFILNLLQLSFSFYSCYHLKMLTCLTIRSPVWLHEIESIWPWRIFDWMRFTRHSMWEEHPFTNFVQSVHNIEKIKRNFWVCRTKKHTYMRFIVSKNTNLKLWLCSVGCGRVQWHHDCLQWTNVTPC